MLYHARGGENVQKYALLFAALAVLLVGACRANSPDTPDIVARVNGMEIARSEFETELAFEISVFTRQGMELSAQDRETLKKLVVERLINNRLLLDAAQAAGITPDTVDVEASVLAIVRLYGDEDALAQELEVSGLTMDRFRMLVTEALIIEELFEAKLQLSAVQVTEEEIAAEVEKFLAAVGDVEELEDDLVWEYVANELARQKAEDLKYQFIKQLRDNSEIEYFGY